MLERIRIVRRCLAQPVLALMVATALGIPSLTAATLEPERLRCEYLQDPVGIDDPRPQLSWRCASHDPRARRLHQSAWRILVASTPELLAHEQGDLWDSGQVTSDQTLHIAYAGTPLTNLQHCVWSVRIWDQAGQPSAWSSPASWTMGMLNATRWTAEWIGSDHAKPISIHGDQAASTDSASFAQARWLWSPGESGATAAPAGPRWFGIEVTIPATPAIAAATVYLAGDDTFTSTINGKPALSGGGWASVVKADILPLLHAGENAVRVQVVNASPGPAGLIGTLDVRMADGTVHSYPTSANWHSSRTEPTPGSSSAWPTPAEELGANGMAPWGKVTLKPTQSTYLPATYLRRPFIIADPPVRAVLVATALGHLDLHLNGERLSDEVFAPGWSDYRKHVAYRVYDVTSRLHAGENVLGAILGDGWFRGSISVLGQNRYGTKTRLRAELHLIHRDGRDEVIASDGSWSAATGAILETDMFAGEVYDARREARGWDAPGFDAAAWIGVDKGAEVQPLLRFYRAPPVRPQQELPAKTVTERTPGTFVLDLGQNIAGWARLHVHEPAGTVITLRFAEMLNQDGTLYTTALRSARATDTYVCRGGSDEIWQPRFTYHGFRYIEVAGLSAAPTPTTVIGVAVHSDLPETTTFSCSDPLISTIAANTLWGQRGNYVDLPTDCPQRDERMGWTGDTQVFACTAAYQMEVGAFLGRWMDEMLDAQSDDGRFPIMAPAPHAGWSPGWSDAGVIIPWTLYHDYGDTRLAERCFHAMQAHLAYYSTHSPGLIGPAEGFGDWLAIGSDTPKDLIATAYFAHSAHQVAEMAEALGRHDDATTASTLADSITAAFQHRFVHADGTVGSGSQTSYLLALRFGLISAEQRHAVAEHLVQALSDKNWHLSTGFLGVNLLLPTLSDIGHSDLAYRLLQNTTYPSWGYSIAQGATTMWERWNSYTKDHGFGEASMNSFNHYAYGACGEWLYRTVLGIDAAQPGYAVVSLHAEPGGGLTWAKGSYESLHGAIASAWTSDAQGISWSVTIPPNTTGQARMPTSDLGTVTEQGHALTAASGFTKGTDHAGNPVVTFGSGTYQFHIPVSAH